jgi:hypothetical protein
LIALGIVAGVILNLVKQQGRMPWWDPIVVMSGVLLVWLIVATIFEWTYKPAQQGRKVAYLTVASFVMLALVMVLLVMGSSNHTRPQSPASGQRKLAGDISLALGTSTLPGRSRLPLTSNEEVPL